MEGKVSKLGSGNPGKLAGPSYGALPVSFTSWRGEPVSFRGKTRALLRDASFLCLMEEGKLREG